MAIEPKSQHAPQTPVDFAIVTALKEECAAVRARLQNAVKIQEDGDSLTYYYGDVEISGEAGCYSVVVTMLLGMGNDEAAIATTKLIRRWQPQNVLMVGIAGGIKGKVDLGDVVVAESCHYYEAAKRTPVGEQRRPQQFAANRILLGRAQAYDESEWRSDIQVEQPGTTPDDHARPRVRFGHIASGEKVIADNDTVPALLRENAKIVAVAMEGAGVARAVSDYEPAPRFLEIRGICDFADPEKNDAWHDYAANAAAAFTIGLLKSCSLTPLSKEKVNGASQSPLLILRAQSLRAIGADEVLGAFDASLQGRVIETVSLDFTDLVSNDVLIDPAEAVQRIADPSGRLFGALARRSEASLVFHGLAHIPLVILTGSLITDRQQVRLFDFHEKTWVWPELESFPDLLVQGLPEKPIRKQGDIVVRVSISYAVHKEQTRAVIPKPSLEIDLTLPQPERGVIRSEEQVLAYGRLFRQVMDAIAHYSPQHRTVHLFYGGPMSLAFHLGQQISANIHPVVVAWNFRRGAYEWGIDLSAAANGDECIVSSVES